MVRLLLKHGANKSATDGRSLTAADHARRSLKVEAFAVLAETPSELEQLSKLREVLVPATPNSPWVGRWTNRKDGFSTVMAVFEKDGSFGFSSSMAVLRGGWRVVQADRLIATPIWPEEQLTPAQKSEVDKLKTTLGKLAFQQRENPLRLQVNLGSETVELFPVP